MRQAVTIAIFAGKPPKMIFGSDKPIDEQLRWIKEKRVEGFECESIEFWDSDGTRRKYHMPQPAQKNGAKHA